MAHLEETAVLRTQTDLTDRPDKTMDNNINQIPERAFHEHVEKVKNWTNAFYLDTGRSPLYFIRTFGCQQNDRDSELAAGILEKMGFRGTEIPEEADLVLFNTCSVRANADHRFYGHLGRLKPVKKGGWPLIGVFGCMMEQDVHVGTITKTFPYVDFILGAGAVRTLPFAVTQVLFNGSRKQKTVNLTNQRGLGDDVSLPIRRSDPHRALITIMTGCDNFCSYCIVPYTRGRERSRSYDRIMEEAENAVKQGVKEILLLGQNVNSYGNDRRKRGEENAPDFASLLQDISRLEGLWAVRYMTSHPKDLSDKLIDVISGCPRVESHIHLPLQSGSDRLLKRMNRRYDAAHYLDLVRKLRACRSGITVSTDIIVGFPGETEEDWRATLRVMEEAAFDAAFTFLYSPRVGTPAADWYDESQHEIVQERFERLVEYQNELSLRSNRAMEGRIVEVLVDGESRRDPSVLSGRTHDDRLVNFGSVQKDLRGGAGDTPPLLPTAGPGDVVRVLVKKAGPFSLDGEIIRE